MLRRHITNQQREGVAERARDCCEYCRSQEDFASHTFEVDHIVPLSRGGKTMLGNLALACRGCNTYKDARTKGVDPRTGRTVRLYHPRKQQWGKHFEWNEDFTLIIGLTPTGRATVETLRLNRKGLVNQRRVLREVGEHPPAVPDRAD